MKKLLYVFLLVALLWAAFAPAALAADPVTDRDVLKDLAAVRAATAKYHDVAVAEAAGYVPVGHCTSAPGLGAMGIHYLNPGLAMDNTVSLTEPELLLYLPNGEGGLKLVAVEYFVGLPFPPPYPPAPTLFGRSFDGPMAGHEPGMPWHYDLHVWVWQNNPDGMFASFNPSISCE